MNSIESMALFLVKKWGSKTLASFRADAEREFNGTLFESIRADGGPRMLLIICLTGTAQIRKLENRMIFQSDQDSVDWEKTTLAEIALQTEKGNGMSYQDVRNLKRRREAILLCATRPESMRTLQDLFGISN